MWICDPVFLGRKPVNTFHKQLGEKITVDESLQDRHMLVRCAFEAKAGEKLILKITADDFYKLYLNGVFLGAGPAQAYADRYPYNTYELTALNDGTNVIAVHVFYAGTVTRGWQSADERQGLWFELADENGALRAESASECKYIIPTAWRDRGPLCHHLTQFVEEVFAAEIPAGWQNSDFDDSAWENACENPADDHTVIPQITPIVSIYDVKPILVERRGDTWFADMGAEVVGTVKARIAAKDGGVIEFRMGEELNDDGTVRHQLRCECDYRMWWNLSGRETDETDFFDYMAFRYIEIVDPDNKVDPDSIRTAVRHYPMADGVGIFRSESPLADGIFNICRRGVMLGAQEAFLDCPSREKGQYLGDGTITAHAHLLLTGDRNMYKKMLLDFAASAVICPGLMAVAPGNLMQEIADYSCQYPEQILTYYELTGDIDTVKQLMPTVDALEDYFDRHRREHGLIELLTEKWNLVDWPMNLRDGYEFKLSQPIGPGVHNVINAFYYGLKRDADRLRSLLGLPLRGEAEAIKETFLKTFRLDNGLFRDAVGSSHTALHSVVLPLYYGMIPKADIPAAIECIREKRMCCGVYMAYFVLKALARCGEYDLMNELTFSEEEHSWGNMLKEGATSCWEAWGKDQKWNTSLCHPWASAPIIIMLEDMAGIRAAKPGFEEISINPHMPDWLGDITLNFNTVRGLIEATRISGEWTLNIV